MPLKAVHYMRRAISLPPGESARKAWALARRWARETKARRSDLASPTFATSVPFAGDSVGSFLSSLAARDLAPRAAQRAALAAPYLDHRFDLLGSGWVEVVHGMSCEGLEGHLYDARSKIEPDPGGDWLESRVSPPNLEEARRRWRLIDSGYRPIDWHRDFKSGYRWSETTRFSDIRFGHQPGVDVKVPWELGRLQHLPLLALAYASAALGLGGFAAKDRYGREVRNQILDFAATNPPRFGVQWHCPMDIAIRIVNIVLACDILRVHGADIDPDFDAVLTHTVYEHGRHVLAHIEWDETGRGNHYLCDVVGLLFAGAYLPGSPESDAWLAYGARRLIRETEDQFHVDGSNFEASTSYHRLSAETVVWATALLRGLPEDRAAALETGRSAILATTPGWNEEPDVPGRVGGETGWFPFPDWFDQRLSRMAAFTMAATRPDGRVVQVGDNDNGRLVKLEPAVRSASVGAAIAPAEEVLDHRHLVGAVGALLGRRDLTEFSGGETAEAALIRSLVAGNAADPAPGDEPSGATVTATGLAAFPDFGLFVRRTTQLYVAVRCGGIGQRGRGGHAHNDQLSIEVAARGVPFIVDPGTYVYTPLPDRRNQFRGTEFHNTLCLEDQEQASWPPGPGGLFMLSGDPRARVVEVSEQRFVGEHHGFGAVHRRTIAWADDGMDVVDRCRAPGEKLVSLHLDPGVEVGTGPDATSIVLASRGVSMSARAADGRWSVEPCLVSPAYGRLEESRRLLLRGAGEEISWRLAVGPPARE